MGCPAHEASVLFCSVLFLGVSILSNRLHITIGDLCRYVQHWDLTDAVIVVKQEGGEEETSCGLSPDSLMHGDSPSQEIVLDHTLPTANAIIVLTDGDGTDSYLSSHLTSQFTANGGSQFTANAESSRFTTNALSSLLHPLPMVGASNITGAASQDASSSLQHLQPTDHWLPTPSLTSTAAPAALNAVPEMVEQEHEVHTEPVEVEVHDDWEGHHEQELSVASSTAAGVQSQLQAEAMMTAEQRMQLRLAAVEGRNSVSHSASRTASRREHEFSIDFDLTDALMSKEMARPQGTDSIPRRAPQVPEEPAVPSFVDDDALSIALGAFPALACAHALVVVHLISVFCTLACC